MGGYMPFGQPLQTILQTLIVGTLISVLGNLVWAIISSPKTWSFGWLILLSRPAPAWARFINDLALIFLAVYTAMELTQVLYVHALVYGRAQAATFLFLPLFVAAAVSLLCCVVAFSKPWPMYARLLSAVLLITMQVYSLRTLEQTLSALHNKAASSARRQVAQLCEPSL